MMGVAILIWMLSGSPIITASPYYLQYQVLLAVVVALICLGRGIHFSWMAPFVPVAAIYIAWFFVASLSGIGGQLPGLAGQLLKIGTVAMLFGASRRPMETLIQAMILLCSIALVIFFVRHVLLLVGIDIADAFKIVYSLTGQTSERSIFVFNFHTTYDTFRNSGPFREPGMFAANIIITLIMLISPYVSFDPRDRKRYIFILLASLITANSTMGVIAAVPIGLLFLVQSPYLKGKLGLVVVVLAVGVGGLLAAGSDHLDKIAAQLELTETQSNTWYQSRFGNAYVDYVAITQRPLLGYGFAEENRPILWDREIQARYGGGDSLRLGNGLTGTIVKFGIPTTLLLYMLFFRRLIGLQGGWMGGTASFAALLVILFSQQLLLLPAVFALCGTPRPLTATAPRSSRSARSRSPVLPMPGGFQRYARMPDRQSWLAPGRSGAR